MKKFLFAFFIALCSWGAVGDTGSVYTGDAAQEINKQYNWSYGALAEVMKSMRPQCEPTTKYEFLEMGNWFREKKARFSFYDLMHQCVTQYKKFQNIVRTDDKKCELPPPCDANSLTCSEKDYTDISGCNIFITTLLEHNNTRARILGENNPGTYVTQAQTPDGQLVYRINDVILADGYWKDGHIDNGVNNDEKNTTIWDITSGTPVDTGLKTWTNDMFFAVEATNTTQGSVGGAFVNSYIFPHVDLTDDIYDKYYERRGSMWNSLGNAWDSFGAFDVKKIYSAMYNMPGQIETETHSNAAIFGDRVAHFDWLGHLLFGMNREESSLPNSVADNTAQAVSVFTNKDYWRQYWRTIRDPFHARQNIKKLKETITYEPLNMQNAWDVGSSLVEQIVSQRIMTFENVRAKESEAKEKAQNELLRLYPNARDVSCSGTCTSNIVVCTALYDTEKETETGTKTETKQLRLEFVFRDSCFINVNTSTPSYVGPGKHF